MQLRLYGDAAERGDWLDARIETAEPHDFGGGLITISIFGGVAQYNGFFRYHPQGAKMEYFGKAGPVPGLGSSKELLDAVFAANIGDVKGPILVGQGVVLCKVIEKTAFDRVAFDGQKEQIRDRLKNLKSGQLLQSLLARRRAEAKVDVNKELLARFGASS